MGLQYLIWIGFDRIHACAKVHVYVHVGDLDREINCCLFQIASDPWTRPILWVHWIAIPLISIGRYWLAIILSDILLNLDSHQPSLPITTLCSILFRHNGIPCVRPNCGPRLFFAVQRDPGCFELQRTELPAVSLFWSEDWTVLRSIYVCFMLLGSRYTPEEPKDSKGT